MDRDFQARYQQAEQAYGEGSNADAQAIALELLSELENTPPVMVIHQPGSAGAASSPYSLATLPCMGWTNPTKPHTSMDWFWTVNHQRSKPN